jgi:hypothetical protein
MHSILNIAKRLIQEQFFVPYRINQDHLEMFFSRIRRKGGWRNNPNSEQFRWALRSLLQKNGVQASHNANCQAIVPVVHSSEETTTMPIEQEAMKQLLMSEGTYKDEVLYFISGYIAKKLSEKQKCDQCSSLLQRNPTEEEESSELHMAYIKRVDRGGLCYASNDLWQVVRGADAALRKLLVENDQGPMCFVNEDSLGAIVNLVQDNISQSVFDKHPPPDAEIHKKKLVQQICSYFTQIMFHHHAKLFNDRFILKNKCSLRHHLTKTMLFLHI